MLEDIDCPLATADIDPCATVIEKDVIRITTGLDILVIAPVWTSSKAVVADRGKQPPAFFRIRRCHGEIALNSAVFHVATSFPEMRSTESIRWASAVHEGAAAVARELKAFRMSLEGQYPPALSASWGR